jgi:dethiobiotin synthetase
VVVGTGTGVGKTVFTTFAAGRLRAKGVRVAALKPLCSGGRGDALQLREAAASGLSLDVINPWWFRAALTPREAARRAGLAIQASEVVNAVQRVESMDFERVLVEGAGGLLSPLAEALDSRGLIRELGAAAVLVAANRLGMLNEVFLTVEALPPRLRDRVPVVVMAPERPSLVTRTNLGLLRERFGEDRVVPFPFVREVASRADRGMPSGVARAVDRVLALVHA